MPTTQSQTENAIAYGFIIERTSKAIKQQFQRMLREVQAGLTVDQWIILHELYLEEPLSQWELAQRTFKHPPAISRLMDSLLALDFVYRREDERDARRHNVYLTEAGRAKVTSLLPVVQRFRESGMADVPTAELQKALDVLNRIFHHMQSL